MHFGEYELSPSLIGLSLLPSPHPEAFQRFTRFRVCRIRLRALFRLAFAPAARIMPLNLAGHGNS